MGTDDEYAELFSRINEGGKTIKNIEVKEIDQMPTFKIVLTLWDGTLTTSPLPGWCREGENKDFVFYYVHKDPLWQEFIDKILDQVIEDALLNELEKLARNVNWAISVAVCKAGARCKETSLYEYIAELAKGHDDEFDSKFDLPTPSFNITNGGLNPENRLAEQHLVVLPLLANSFHDAIRIIRKIYNEYFKVQTGEIGDRNAFDEGDGGSYSPSIKDIKDCLRSLKKFIADVGYEDKVSIGVNIGASKFYSPDKTYRLNFSEENSNDSPGIGVDALKEAYDALLREFSLVSLEDTFHMDDQEYSSQLTQRVDRDQDVVMEFDPDCVDDMSKVMSNQVCNSFHLKMGQIGSVTKCITFVIMAKVLEWSIDMSSHDSCETSDPFIADFCAGLSLEKMKIGVSCITSACNVCDRVRELEIKRAEENWSRPIQYTGHQVRSELAKIRIEEEMEFRAECRAAADADIPEFLKKSYLEQRDEEEKMKKKKKSYFKTVIDQFREEKKKTNKS